MEACQLSEVLRLTPDSSFRQECGLVEGGQGAEMAAGPGGLWWGWSWTGWDLCSVPHSLGGDGRPEGGSWHPGCGNLRHVALSPCFQRLGPLQGWEAGWDPCSDMGVSGLLAGIWGAGGIRLPPGSGAWHWPAPPCSPA